MSSQNTPTDPGQLRDEIQQTRADLGETVEGLAAKTNVKGRAKHAAGQLTAQAKDALGGARDQVAQAAGTVADKASTTASSVKESVSNADLATTVRRPVPLAAIGIAAVLVGLAIYLVRRSRS